MPLRYGIWVHDPKYNEAGAFVLVAQTEHQRQAFAVAKHEQTYIGDRTVRIWKQIGPTEFEAIAFPGESVR
jgi:hypothetical protein